MGSVTSTLERMVIDVAWTFHEWFYGGGASGGGTTATLPVRSLARPVRKRRHLPSRSAVRRTVSAAAACRYPLPHPHQRLAMTLDSDSDISSPLFASDVRVTSTPVLLDRRRRSARHRAESQSTDSDDHAALFRCSGGGLPVQSHSRSLPVPLSAAAMNAASAAGLRGLYTKREALGHRRCASASASASAGLPVLPPLLPTHQRVACLRV